MAALHAFLATCRSADSGSPAAPAQPAPQPPGPRRAPGSAPGRGAPRPGGAGGGGPTLALAPRQARRLARLVRRLALACHADLQACPYRAAGPALWPQGLPSCSAADHWPYMRCPVLASNKPEQHSNCSGVGAVRGPSCACAPRCIYFSPKAVPLAGGGRVHGGMRHRRPADLAPARRGGRAAPHRCSARARARAGA